MATYKEMVDKDIEFMYSIHDYCNRTAWLQDLMLLIVSNHPLKDVTTIMWIIHFIGIIELGSNHFWVVMFNLVVVVIARRILEAKRPVEFDPDLQPTTDLSAESYAFPSLESYMSVVIIGHMFVTTKYITILPLGGALVFLVGFSRVYSRSRFPHQIVGSWILGMFGLIAGFAFCSMMKIDK
ncbi:phosphatase PAP2 family protein [archaeon]|nr:MAG: phosphatase PAP2 family protein [archaeon]